MAEVKWIKITTDIFSDEKILLIEQMPEADTMLVIWFKLLCMAGRDNNNGIFLMNNRIPYTEEMLATLFRRPINTVRMAISTFEAFGMIDIIDDVISLVNWEKHQNIDGLERIREKNRERNRKYRERKKLSLQDSMRDVTVTQRDALEEDIDIDKEKNIYIRPKHPTVEEVRAYCVERKNNVDPQKFVDFYTANGWVQGKGKPIKDWKAAVRTWERNKPTSPKKNAFTQITQNDYDFDSLEKDLLSN